MKWKKGIFSLAITGLILTPFTKASGEELLIDQPAEQLTEPRYSILLNEWEQEGIGRTAPFEQSVPPSEFLETDPDDLLPEEDSHEYGGPTFYWEDQQSVTIEVETDEEGLYELAFDYFPLGDGIVPIEGAVEINGEYPFFESRKILFPVTWQDQSSDFEEDRYGNEIVPSQVMLNQWHYVKANDSSYLHAEPLKYYLEEGRNEITLTNIRGEMLLGNVYINHVEEPPSYEDYLSAYSGDTGEGTQKYTVEAEHPLHKNSSFIRAVNSQDVSVVPYETTQRLLNTFGGDSWKESGQSVTWEVEVERDGFYQLTLKVLQDKGNGGPVFRNVLINGEVPFEEMYGYRFHNNNRWTNETLSNDEGQPYWFYLEEGANTLTLIADASPVNRTLMTIENMMQEIESLTLSIKQLTGNQLDRARGWRISEYIPEIDEILFDWADELEHEQKRLFAIGDGTEYVDVVQLDMAAERLRALAESPDEIPFRLTELSEGSASVAQILGTVNVDLREQPLLMDRFYVHGDQDVPEPRAGLITRATESVSRFFHSFRDSSNMTVGDVEEDTLEVWVNRPRQYVELLQHMADQTFTPQTGIEVQFSLMPDESKLILASAANSQPDLAIGISNWLPYELAIRGSAVDLRQFDDFDEYITDFSPGAFLPLIVEDGVYGFPETQDFYVLYYRRDILDALNIPVPDTWDDVTDILPELQRFGLNFYTPMAGAVAFKPFMATAPFIYQNQGDLYEEDGIGTVIDSDASLRGIQFMAELNTIYSLPLQVPNFYNHFRYSTLPVGISNFETYVQLTAAAPEISGWWDIALYPGVEKEDGEVERWATGSGQAGMIFENSEKEEAAWEVLKWWMSTETQTEFATNLQITYGPEYMWNTANLESFAQLPWPEEHKEVILDQWEYLKEVPKTPYTYMVEREISNVWNTVVFDGENTRSAVDDAVINIDREMRRKMEEFGYMENGEVVRPYPIPTIEMVEGWMEDANQ